MGYRKYWRQSLASIAVILAAFGAFVAVVYWAKGKQFAAGPGENARNVRLIASGSAPRGVAIVYIDQTGSHIFERHTLLPFRTVGPIEGRNGSFGAFAQVEVVPRSVGTITCTVRIGSAVKFGHSTGTNTCTASLSYDPRSGTWS